MAAEVRQGATGAWIVDLECGLEQRWGDDRAGAAIAASDHNDERHRILGRAAI